MINDFQKCRNISEVVFTWLLTLNYDNFKLALKLLYDRRINLDLALDCYLAAPNALNLLKIKRDIEFAILKNICFIINHKTNRDMYNFRFFHTPNADLPDVV